MKKKLERLSAKPFARVTDTEAGLARGAATIDHTFSRPTFINGMLDGGFDTFHD